ncbi:MAG: hypothetical protein GH144_02645 [Clostridia bacterium]|jgi:phage terminase large subunit|nr:hypothetical protein [Clostridia bacterium]
MLEAKQAWIVYSTPLWRQAGRSEAWITQNIIDEWATSQDDIVRRYLAGDFGEWPGLSVEALSQLYDLPEEEIRKGIDYLNRSWLQRLYSGFKQLFRNIVFQAKMKFTILGSVRNATNSDS